MLERFETLSIEERLPLMLGGSHFAYYCANIDRKNYLATLEGKEVEFYSEDEKTRMKILSLLDRLGYSLNHLGTYLYKELICLCMKKLVCTNTREDILSCREYLKLLKDRQSYLHYDLAKFDLEIGVNFYHSLIEDAINSVDYEKANQDLLSQIYSGINFSIDYGENAFLLAAYLTRKKSDTLMRFTKVPDIRKLINKPNKE